MTEPEQLQEDEGRPDIMLAWMIICTCSSLFWCLVGVAIGRWLGGCL